MTSVNAFNAVAKVFDYRQTPVKVFFRNDDGGWADERLQKLAREFAQQDLPLDIAVIPDALSQQSIDVIVSLLEAHNRASIHQHGFTHVNHQLSGRSCEFGSDRSCKQQYADIAAGQKKLAGAFGSKIEPVFTPPWNRCTSDTVEALQSLGFQYLSRIVGSEPVSNVVPELPVAVDWLKKRKGERLNTDQLVEYICSLFATEDEVVGVMLHHEHMDQENRLLLFQFIEVLRESQMVSFHSMMDIGNDGKRPERL